MGHRTAIHLNRRKPVVMTVMVLWVKPLGMSSVFYLVAVLGDQAVVVAGHLKSGTGLARLHILLNE